MPIITKIESAERNLKEAIKLFFEKRDAVAIHTLAASAQGVIRDIAKSRSLPHTSILHDNPGIENVSRSQWINAINAPRNFFKHADRDTEGVLEFNEIENIHLILDAVLVLGEVSNEYHHEASVFLGWFTIANPETASAVRGNVIGDYCVRNRVDPLDFSVFRELLKSEILIEPLTATTPAPNPV